MFADVEKEHTLTKSPMTVIIRQSDCIYRSSRNRCSSILIVWMELKMNKYEWIVNRWKLMPGEMKVYAYSADCWICIQLQSNENREPWNLKSRQEEAKQANIFKSIFKIIPSTVNFSESRHSLA